MTEANDQSRSEEVAQPVTTDASQAQETVEVQPAVSPSDVNKNSAPSGGASAVPNESGDAERQRELEQQGNNQQSSEA